MCRDYLGTLLAVIAVAGHDLGARLGASVAFSAVMVADCIDRVALHRTLVEAISMVVAEHVEADHNLVLVLVLVLAVAGLCLRKGCLSLRTDSTSLPSQLEMRGTC